MKKCSNQPDFTIQIVDAESLLNGKRKVNIKLKDKIYTLILTKSGKLILN